MPSFPSTESFISHTQRPLLGTRGLKHSSHRDGTIRLAVSGPSREKRRPRRPEALSARQFCFRIFPKSARGVFGYAMSRPFVFLDMPATNRIIGRDKERHQFNLISRGRRR